MKIVCISDTHGLHRPSDLPDGDMLIHAGDLSMAGHIFEIQQELAWLRRFPHKYKIFIGGNHDAELERMFVAFDQQMKPYKKEMPLIYLRDSMLTIDGLRIYGSPVSRAFGRIRAFAKEGEDLIRHWERIPECDVLITHGPPFGIRDMAYSQITWNGAMAIKVEALGDKYLRKRVEEIKPKLHVFGHIHGGHGVEIKEGRYSVNAALLDDQYHPTNEPIVIEL